jgi:hypothetical protein
MHAIVSAQEASKIRTAIPPEVAVLKLDPVVALLVTLYVVYIGQIVGEEMAATVGFPDFPADRTERLELMRDLEYDLDVQWAVKLIEQLERSLHLASVTEETAEDDQAAEEDLLAAAIFNQGERTDLQSKILAKILSVISEDSTRSREDMEFWEPGIKAIARITRLMIEAVPPTRVGTLGALSRTDSGLRLISTLGGALFLGQSIRILDEPDPETSRSRYADLGIRIARLTHRTGGQQVRLPNAEAADQYVNGLLRFVRRGDSVFAVEHPFHFRVLLEVMSDENRRYPAESVLNVEALRSILPGTAFWGHVVWSRDQLPVVGNLLRLPERQRADAFIQHYAAFGRTPHTSSFTHLDYEVRSPVGDDHVSEAWPTAFRGFHGKAVHNMPNSVCQIVRAVDRQRWLGRLWRGTPEENDLRWICGQMVAWDGHRESDGALTDRVWHSDRWIGQTFPVAAMAEIRTGAWLLEALRLRLATAVSPVAKNGAEYQTGQERPDPELKANEELRCVLEIMTLFSADYLSGDGDGIRGLKKTLSQLRDRAWFVDLGPTMSEKLDYLVGALDSFGGQLGAEIRLARDGLKNPDMR